MSTPKYLGWMWALAGVMLCASVTLTFMPPKLPPMKVPIDQGVEYADAGNFTEAIAEFTRQIEKNPRDAAAYTNRGLTYERQGKEDLALADYTKAISLNPKDASAYNNRAALYADSGEFERSAADLSRAIDLVPEDGQLYRNRAIVYGQTREFDKAWQDVAKAREFGASFDPAFIEDLKKASGR